MIRCFLRHHLLLLFAVVVPFRFHTLRFHFNVGRSRHSHTTHCCHVYICLCARIYTYILFHMPHNIFLLHLRYVFDFTVSFSFSLVAVDFFSSVRFVCTNAATTCEEMKREKKRSNTKQCTHFTLIVRSSLIETIITFALSVLFSWRKSNNNEPMAETTASVDRQPSRVHSHCHSHNWIQLIKLFNARAIVSFKWTNFWLVFFSFGQILSQYICCWLRIEIS